jgi:hypothetical protein
MAELQVRLQAELVTDLAVALPDAAQPPIGEAPSMISVGSMTRSASPSRSIRAGSAERGLIWIVTPGASADRRRTSGPISRSTL